MHKGIFQLAVLVALLFSFDSRASAAGRCASLFVASEPQFDLPSEVRTYSMLPTLVRKTHVYRSAEFMRSLERIRSSMAKLPIGEEILRAVLYPMAGFDLTTALFLFPKTETYILIDGNSVVPAAEVSRRVKIPLSLNVVDRNGRWVHYEEVGHEVFRNLVSSLFAQIPKAKITSIEFIVDSKANVSLKLGFYDPVTERDKTVWYLAGELGAGVNWWDSLLEYIAPRALIVKGSMSVLRLTGTDRGLPHRESLVAPILDRGGMVVEGASRLEHNPDAYWARNLDPHRDRWELTDGDPRFADPRHRFELMDVEFSYQRRVRVSVYDAMNFETTPRERSPSGF